MNFYRGIPVSSGVAIGPVFKPRLEHLGVGRDNIADTATEEARFHEALETAKAQVRRLIEQLRAGGRQTELEILESQLMMFEDASLIDGVVEKINTLN